MNQNFDTKTLYKASDDEHDMLIKHYNSINALQTEIRERAGKIDDERKYLSLVHEKAFIRDMLDKVRSGAPVDMNDEPPIIMNPDGTANVVYNTNTKEMYLVVDPNKDRAIQAAPIIPVEPINKSDKPNGTSE